MTDKESPYLLEDPPTSTGRIFLPRAFWHWCALHYGLSPGDIAAAFSPTPPNRSDASQVALASRLLGECVARDQIASWVRPFGGGTPARLTADRWELDDFRVRFATGAVDPKRPFDAEAEPTHWLFLEMDDYNAVVEASLAQYDGRHRVPPTARPPAGAPEQAIRSEPAERFLRLPEVKSRTGLSRSTIYRRIGERRFPSGVDLGGNVTGWREGEIAAWVANPT